ncbi:WASH complex subunit 1-like [Dendroctonus ponderosae]|uniref:WH2 domain-containing protein n=1 Tax=Dendroctonus ponderosae TaxID=77166 RepID=U4UPZ8_DENPD|nr:WASH complex subunit 1 [Dendroctonus ponderosae]XP_048518327.1 WASH complex subunit 1-like [Dendroctonus ponderosae]ERL96144.1 hypothetical protein D910_01171 [Dendroctonus ponderosae]KAH1007586.1 hypothetical protein HUJ04_004799 [Dendroctonus ponderosae]
MSHYKIQTIPHNLSKEETIVQMVEILDHLDAITQDVFSRVGKRLEENNAKLSSIFKRIDAASAKVANLKGDKKAKTVFSSSKYPAADINRDYVSIFKEPVTVERVRHEVPHGKRVSTFEPVSKLQFYHVKVPEMNNNQVPEGLGDVPNDISCVNDLLLFNTGKNVYKDFKPNDYCKSPTIIRQKDNYATSELGAAPVSISQRASMQQANKDSYFYTPKIEQLPALDVPWDLPNLPGIADDVRYEVEGSEAAIISPSAVNSSQVVDVDLPDISTFTAVEVPSPPPPPPLIDIPLPPPIEQMPVEAQKTAQPDKPPSVPQPPVHMAPPPPVHMEPPPPVPTLQSDPRASLMDAIRKAGGSKVLRKTNEQSQASAPKGGDLMADLHLKLQMRRKGISGSKQTDQGHLGGADSAFARMSSIIPPPTKSSDMGSSVSTDDDDDDAWNDD